ncbi:G-type lectin S-receptor-like serine/threonine-protein kinase At2g19130 [Cryptomeria japonica]|uniref:G-type lectin S-receptor-like serine/threonine-protein kinase At2g19130 n=1 Tax=Cryptomeria japonica TaxID=3369 RepID=UPI0027D9F27E|nr:G-type lectin S-receptor-like serine/threonine-protein kinase At2g19130 [Cryptomeria japonica]
MVIKKAMKYLLLAISMIIAVNNCISLGLGGGDTLLPGDLLAGNQAITSKNGTFALGFFSPKGTNNWYIGIWYARMSPKTIVWVANRDKPVRSMPGVLKFSSHARLGLFDREGRSVWSPDPVLKGSRAIISESGNFIMLGDGQNKSEIVWESFTHPGDTWLPGMKMWKGMKLTSWKSSVDPATGLFSMGMDISPGKTQMLMVYNNSNPYWYSGEWTGNSFANAPEAYIPNKFVVSCVTVSPSSIYVSYSIFPSVHILTGKLQVDEKGHIGLYFGMDDCTWSQVRSSYGGQCNKYDICGPYGLCNGNDTCGCIEGFTPKNYTQDVFSSGCARRKPLHCSVTAGTTDGFLESKNRYLPKEKAVSYNNESTLQGCRTACLKNCSCTAFVFFISDLPICRMWFSELFKMGVSSDSQSVFIRLAASELPLLTSERRRKAPALHILLPAAAASSSLLGIVLAAFILWKRRRLWKKSAEEDVPTSLKAFTYKELRIATENFKHKLGSGAFGSVFKGSRRLPVYAYMPNGSLNSSLFYEEGEAGKVLDWKTRFEIALGTARGLVYLHEECKDRIIHCDIKPENILLDGDFSPQIADFGLAKLVGRDFSRVLTTTRGTRGYLAPEWISALPITSKVDVYSFGMTFLEILSGRRNLDLKVEESRLYFPTWASSQIGRGNIIGVVDVRIASEANIEELRRAAVVATLCIQDDEDRRPSMGEVVRILEGTIEAPAPEIPRSLQVLVDQVEDRDTA